VRACKAFSDKSNSSSMFEEVKMWLNQLEALLWELRSSSESILSYSECWIVTKGDEMAVQRVQAANREFSNVPVTLAATVASLSTLVGGDGALLVSVYLITGNLTRTIKYRPIVSSLGFRRAPDGRGRSSTGRKSRRFLKPPQLPQR